MTDKIARITDRIERLPPIVILRLRNMTAIDATGRPRARGAGRSVCAHRAAR